MPRVCFIADLHLFTRRTRGHQYLEAIRRAASGADHCVLGGDIFDFKWSTLPSMHATVEAALEWLRDLTQCVPQCNVHFLLGNHDHHHELIQRLPSLQEQISNFDWEHYYLRLGDTVFLHGDVADRKMTAARLEQRRTAYRHGQRGRMHNRAYDMAVRARLHAVLAHTMHPRRLVAQRILCYLREVGHGPENGIRQVCFGHTHRAIEGFQHAGVIFHNGGAPIGRSAFRILELDVAHGPEAHGEEGDAV